MQNNALPVRGLLELGIRRLQKPTPQYIYIYIYIYICIYIDILALLRALLAHSVLIIASTTLLSVKYGGLLLRLPNGK